MKRRTVPSLNVQHEGSCGDYEVLCGSWLYGQLVTSAALAVKRQLLLTVQTLSRQARASGYKVKGPVVACLETTSC